MARVLTVAPSALSDHLLGAATYGAASAYRLAGIAHDAVQRIDDADPLGTESIDKLRGVSALTKLANDASTIGLNVLNANRDNVTKGKEDNSYEAALRRLYGSTK